MILGRECCREKTDLPRMITGVTPEAIVFVGLEQPELGAEVPGCCRLKLFEVTHWNHRVIAGMNHQRWTTD